MALAADKNVRTKANAGTRKNRRPVAADAVIFNGALIALDTDGFVVPLADTAGLISLGVARENVDNTDGDDGDETIEYDTNISVEVKNNAGAIGAADFLAYAKNDEEATDSAGSANKVYLGPVEERTAALVWVHIDESHSAAVAAANAYSDANDST
jgi:hypothetical protein